MFKFLFNNKEEGDIVMSNTRLSKTQKIKNLFERGATVTWKQLRTVYDLKSVSYTHLTLPTNREV